MVATTQTAPLSHTEGNAARVVAYGAVGGIIAALGNFALYAAASAAGVSFAAQFPDGGTSLPVPAIAIMSIMPAIVASLAFVAARKFFGEKGTKIFLGIAAAVFLFFLFPPTTLVGASVGMIVVLELMHVVAAVPIVLGVLKGARG